MTLESEHILGVDENERRQDQKELSRREFFGSAAKGVAGFAAGAALAGHDFALPGSARGAERERSVEELKKDWQDYKEILTSQNVDARVQEIRNKFGAAAKQLLFKVVWDMMDARAMIAREEAGEDLEKSEQGRTFLEIASKTYHRFWNAASIDQRLLDREVREGLSATIAGFDQIPGESFTNEAFKHLIESHFEPRWLYGSIGAYQFDPAGKQRAGLTIAGEAHGGGVGNMLTKSERERIVLYHSKNFNRTDLLPIVAHELAHHHDWERSFRLPVHERLQFLSEVVERFESADHFPSEYVETTTKQRYEGIGADRGEVLYRQVTEFWAVLVERYSVNKDELERQFPKDFALVKKWQKREVAFEDEDATKK